MENSNVEQRTNEHEHERNETGDGLLSADTRRDGEWMEGLSFEFAKSPSPNLPPLARGWSAPSAPSAAVGGPNDERLSALQSGGNRARLVGGCDGGGGVRFDVDVDYGAKDGRFCARLQKLCAFPSAMRLRRRRSARARREFVA